METLIILAIILGTYLMVIAKRITALVRGFAIQSFFLFLYTLAQARRENSIELYAVAGLLFVLKVMVIPYSLNKISAKIKVNDNLGLFMNTQLSLIFAIGFTYGSWIFSKMLVPTQDAGMAMSLTASCTVVLAGLFIMVFRMKALSQTIGLLVMENGIFLLASSIAGGMPFFVEIAIFMDVFISVIILNIFVYRINKLFTHVDVGKLTKLKG
jgi:hydrogenase-4 component E